MMSYAGENYPKHEIIERKLKFIELAQRNVFSYSKEPMPPCGYTCWSTRFCPKWAVRQKPGRMEEHLNDTKKEAKDAPKCRAAKVPEDRGRIPILSLCGKKYE